MKENDTLKWKGEYKLAVGNMVNCRFNQQPVTTIGEVVRQLGEIEECVIQRIVTLTDQKEFDTITLNFNCLPEDIEDCGGYITTYPFESEDWTYSTLSDEDKQLFWDFAVRRVVAVECVGRETFFVDPLGMGVGLVQC